MVLNKHNKRSDYEVILECWFIYKLNKYIKLFNILTAFNS